jgi:hypothetical protein
MLFCTMHAVEGKLISGVMVATIIKSISSAFRPASSRALLAAIVLKSEVACSSLTILLSRIPVREVIHSSDVLTIFSRSWLVMTFSGT